jgi:uncharacterized protein involved in exopolysaccharide biosynthesis
MIGSILSKNRLAGLVEQFDLFPEDRERVPMANLVARMRADVEIELAPEFATKKKKNKGQTASRYRIAFTADDPQIAASVANELATLFVEVNIERRERQARMTTDFLRKQLLTAETEVREYERKIREFNEKYRGELPGELNANVRKLEQLQAQRQSLAMQIAEGETRMAMLLTPADVNPNSPEARLDTLMGRLAAERSYHTDEHPNVIALRRQISSVREEIRDASASPTGIRGTRAALVAGERKALAQLRDQLREVEKQLRELDVRVANTPERQEELNALEEKGNVIRNNYQEFLRKVQEAELAQNLELAQQGERVVVLDRAEPPNAPIEERLQYALIGVAASFGLALAVGLLLEVADPVVISTAHVESAFGLPVLGSVYRIS